MAQYIIVAGRKYELSNAKPQATTVIGLTKQGSFIILAASTNPAGERDREGI